MSEQIAHEPTVDLTIRLLAAMGHDLPDDVTDALSSAYARLRRLDSDLKLIASDHVQTVGFAKHIASQVP